MSRLVAIEGIDGSGKGTQARMLHDRLLAAGTRAALLSFPRYSDTLFGRAVADFLNGRFGALDQVDPFLVSLLYAGDRFESLPVLAQALRTHDVVVLDRYVPSNVAHQGAKLTGARRSEFVDWICRVEYSIYGLPRAERIILLDVPVEIAQRLILTKKPREYTDRAADLHEASAAYLAEVRHVYLDLAAREPGWHNVECAPAGQMRPAEEIGEQILALVEAAS